MDELSPLLQTLLNASALAIAALVVSVVVARSFHERADEHTVLVILGRPREVDGRRVSYRLIVGPGATLRMPIVERVERLDRRPLSLRAESVGALTREHIAVRLDLQVTIALQSDPSGLEGAVEHLLGKSPPEVIGLVREALDPVVRRRIGQRSAEEVVGDPERLAVELEADLDEALHRLGLRVNALELIAVRDSTGKLAALRAQARRETPRHPR